MIFCHSSVLCQVGWRLSVDSHFQVCLEMFDWVQVRLLARPLKDFVPKLLLHCLGCVLRVSVLLQGEPSAQSEVLSNLD